MLDPTDPQYRDAIKLILIANDAEFTAWPKSEVEDARRNIIARKGGIPSLGNLAERFDNEKLTTLLQGYVSEQHGLVQFHNGLQGKDNPCHACSGATDVSYFDFGLARMIKQERDWKSTGISAAISAVTIPLLGVGGLYGPSKTSTAQLLRMRVALCKNCVESRKGIFGGFKANEGNCSAHPMWRECHNAGFTKFISNNELTSWR